MRPMWGLVTKFVTKFVTPPNFSSYAGYDNPNNRHVNSLRAVDNPPYMKNLYRGHALGYQGWGGLDNTTLRTRLRRYRGDRKELGRQSLSRNTYNTVALM